MKYACDRSLELDVAKGHSDKTLSMRILFALAILRLTIPRPDRLFLQSVWSTKQHEKVYRFLERRI